jgi:hypothetical protein
MLADYQWLTSADAEPWLAEAMAAGGNPTVRLTAKLRRDLPAGRVHLVLEQAELRRRAKVKFAATERMFFTRKGLEQASGEAIADYKASRFPAGTPVADLCCGIGGDLLSLARRGPAAGVERDPVTALLAEANLRISGLTSTDVRVATEDVTAFDLAPFTAWHIDPDRRPAGRRTSTPKLHEPSLEQVECMLASSPQAAIKLAPAAVLPDAWYENMEVEWIGWRGECRQQVAWSGALARHPGRRVATVLLKQCSAIAAHSLVEDPDAWLPCDQRVGRYFYDAHAAVLAAGLSVCLGVRHQLTDVNQHGYFTADHLVHNPLLSVFEVLDHFPADQKQIAMWCRAHNIGRLEIKVHGLDWDPNKVRHKLISRGGEGEATLLLWLRDGKGYATLARRIAADEETEGMQR